MSQNPQRRKTKIEPKLESTIVIKQPMERNFSTGGGHLPGDELIENDPRIVTKKWQGYPPENLNVVGKPMPPMPEVAIPRFLGKAEYATRVLLPNMLYAKVLVSPHPHARIKNLDTSKAEKMPGVAYILTYKNGPSTYPLPQELNFAGEVVAVAAAETEDLAEDAVEAIEVEYETLPFASTITQVMAPNAPDLRQGRGNLNLQSTNNLHYDPKASWVAQHGDVERGFAEADIIKEFTYYFAGAIPVPIQPCGGVAKWDGDKLTFWGMGQGIYPERDEIARELGIDATKIRYINKYNGCTFGGAMVATAFNAYVAYIAKMTGRPVKLMFPKDQELARLQIKPENITKLKVGAKKDGRIVAFLDEVYMSAGDSNATWGGGHCSNPIELYAPKVPHWKSIWYCYRTNAIQPGPSRSYMQQEVKWAWENMMDEMAEAVGMDPVQFRLMHIARPGTEGMAAIGGPQEVPFKYDSLPSVEVLEEGAKAFGWDKRNPKPGSAPGRFKRGVGVGMSMHHGGQTGYHDGELYFERVLQNRDRGGGGFGGIYTADVEAAADGYVTMRIALPDSGTNHASALAALVAEILGFTSRDRIRVVWGDSNLAPLSGKWFAGRTITQQGGPVCSAADKLKKDLLQRAADALKVDVTKLQTRDGVISSTGDPRKKITFAALATANKGVIRQTGMGGGSREGRARNKGTGACFVEVEVDTWTGDWRFLRSVYSHDSGLVVNPLVAEADMHGSLVQSFQMTTDSIPWDREFPGTRHYSVGYLSYRIPTIMDVPEKQTQVFVDSLEPRWFFGTKSFSETTIGAVPGAISNAIYNACGVRIREHPITREKILAGLKAKEDNSQRA